ncbi:HupE/UreJ family protein [Azotobacter vinelandii]
MRTRHFLPLLALTLLPGAAFAHPGHGGNGLIAGLLHPLGGLDHLLAMLAIGIWAAQQPRSLKLAVPATFLVALLGGFVLAMTGTGLPQVETGIALSVLLSGLLIACAARLPAPVALTLTAVFALFHGHAHGLEVSGNPLGFAAGFLAASLGLLLGGGLLDAAVQRRLPPADPRRRRGHHRQRRTDDALTAKAIRDLRTGLLPGLFFVRAPDRHKSANRLLTQINKKIRSHAGIATKSPCRQRDTLSRRLFDSKYN